MAADRNLAGVFSRAARTYGREGPGFFEYFGERVAELVPTTTRSSVLDVGYGTGATLVPLASTASLERVVGVELTRDMLVEARHVLDGKELQAVLVAGDAEHLPFRDHVFDAVTSSFA